MVKIYVTREEQKLKGTKWVKVASEKSEMRKESYLNNFQAVDPFMRSLGGKERITKGYTLLGYTTIKDVATSPNKVERIVRTFEVKEGE
jgi:hypothetical protein